MKIYNHHLKRVEKVKQQQVEAEVEKEKEQHDSNSEQDPFDNPDNEQTQILGEQISTEPKGSTLTLLDAEAQILPNPLSTLKQTLLEQNA